MGKLFTFFIKYGKTTENNILIYVFLTNICDDLFAGPVIYCGDPGRVLHASKYGDTFTYGSSVRFDCYPNYELSSGELVLTCTSNGTWSSQLPTCKYKRMYTVTILKF